MPYTTLKLDLDLRDARKRCAAVRRAGWRLQVAEELLHGKITGADVWRTRHGVHVYAVLKTAEGLSNAETIALQAIAGSDPVRELLNLRRTRQPAYRGSDGWNVLFDERTKEVRGRKPDYRKRRASPELLRAFATGLGREVWR